MRVGMRALQTFFRKLEIATFILMQKCWNPSNAWGFSSVALIYTFIFVPLQGYLNHNYPVMQTKNFHSDGIQACHSHKEQRAHSQPCKFNPWERGGFQSQMPPRVPPWQTEDQQPWQRGRNCSTILIVPQS